MCAELARLCDLTDDVVHELLDDVQNDNLVDMLTVADDVPDHRQLSCTDYSTTTPTIDWHHYIKKHIARRTKEEWMYHTFRTFFHLICLVNASFASFTPHLRAEIPSEVV